MQREALGGKACDGSLHQWGGGGGSGGVPRRRGSVCLHLLMDRSSGMMSLGKELSESPVSTQEGSSPGVDSSNHESGPHDGANHAKSNGFWVLHFWVSIPL